MMAAISSRACYLSKMLEDALEARSFSHHPHHTPGSVQILILDARVLIFYLLMPW
jgi:hypothetical protein